jgi:hypothetical protein
MSVFNKFMLYLFIFSVVVAVVLLEYGRGYYHGQIDALTGKIEYKLIVNADSTRTWEYFKPVR